MTAADLDRLSDVYAQFAEHEAQGRSPLNQQLARGVAADRDVLGVLAGLPTAKQQPNLLFAATRAVGALPGGWAQFRDVLLSRTNEVVAVMLTRRTQTNEPARCATLLPLLASLPQPLALLEVGASAGLCLLPDRYAFDFAGHHVPPTRPGPVPPPIFTCAVNAATPLPAHNVDVVWRAGLDLAPIDVRDPAQTAWLEALVWPGEGNRLQLLRAAIDVTRPTHRR